MERANFGMSMVVAPAYILHLKISQIIPAFTFGKAEYCLQALLIVLLSIVLRKFKKGYLFSFVTAVIYGVVLDALMMLIAPIPVETFAVRAICFVAGMLLCSVGVAFFFHTYFAPEAYELVVKEISNTFGIGIAKVKTTYDLTSLTISVLMSFAFFGFLHFEGVKWGTLLTALVNGWIISRISAFMDRKFEFVDKLSWRNFFEA